MMISFYRQGNRSTEKGSHWPRVTQLERSRAGTRAQASLLSPGALQLTKGVGAGKLPLLAPQSTALLPLTLTDSLGVPEVLLRLCVWLQLLTLIADVDPFVFHDLLQDSGTGHGRGKREM